MYAVGIKKVYSTTSQCGLDGARVTDLVDALEVAGSSLDLSDSGRCAHSGAVGAGDGWVMGNGVFVYETQGFGVEETYGIVHQDNPLAMDGLLLFQHDDWEPDYEKFEKNEETWSLGLVV
ncbi:MAG: hypothetical protein M1827_002819 [Pycnora praestabilis]|nr:MAG: hypothetical protein M1827_002819 [Pycnora praestabilis]